MPFGGKLLLVVVIRLKKPMIFFPSVYYLLIKSILRMRVIFKIFMHSINEYKTVMTFYNLSQSK